MLEHRGASDVVCFVHSIAIHPLNSWLFFVLIKGDHPFFPIFWMKYFLPFRKFDTCTFKKILCSNKIHSCYIIFVSVLNLLKMGIYEFGEDADWGKWTCLEGNLTWVNSEFKMGDHHFGTVMWTANGVTKLKYSQRCNKHPAL